MKLFSRIMLVIAAIYVVMAAIQAAVYLFLVPAIFPDVSHEDILSDMRAQQGVSALQLWVFAHIDAVLIGNLVFSVALLVICFGFDRQKRWGLNAMIGLMVFQLAMCAASIAAGFFMPQPFSTGAILSQLFSLAVAAFSWWVIQFLRRPENRSQFT